MVETTGEQSGLVGVKDTVGGREEWVIGNEGSSTQIEDHDSPSFAEDPETYDEAGDLGRIYSNSTFNGSMDETPIREKPSIVPNESNFNPSDFLFHSLEAAMDSEQYDKALVLQSQMAGNINNASNEVTSTIKCIQEAMETHKMKYTILKDRILNEIEANIKISTAWVEKLTIQLKDKYPIEYSKGRSKVLENLTTDEEGLFL